MIWQAQTLSADLSTRLPHWNWSLQWVISHLHIGKRSIKRHLHFFHLHHLHTHISYDNFEIIRVGLPFVRVVQRRHGREQRERENWYHCYYLYIYQLVRNKHMGACSYCKIIKDGLVWWSRIRSGVTLTTLKSIIFQWRHIPKHSIPFNGEQLRRLIY